MEKIIFTEDMYEEMVECTKAPQLELEKILGKDNALVVCMLLSQYWCTYAAECDVTLEDYKMYCDFLTQFADVMFAEAFVSWRKGQDASELVRLMREDNGNVSSYLEACTDEFAHVENRTTAYATFIGYMINETSETLAQVSEIATKKSNEKGYEYVKKAVKPSSVDNTDK